MRRGREEAKCGWRGAEGEAEVGGGRLRQEGARGEREVESDGGGGSAVLWSTDFLETWNTVDGSS